MQLYMTDGQGHKYGIRWKYRLVPNKETRSFVKWCYIKVTDFGTGKETYMGMSKVGKFGKDESRLETLASALDCILRDSPGQERYDIASRVLVDYAQRTRVPGDHHVRGPWQDSLLELLDLQSNVKK